MQVQQKYCYKITLLIISSVNKYKNKNNNLNNLIK